MNVSVTFLGGAQTVTGSKYLLKIDNKKVLVDCGLFQGPKELRLRNWNPLHFPPSEIDYVVITHAHIDHSGYIPKLVKDGFKGKIFCTDASNELITILLRDSAKLQEEEADFANKKGYSKHEKALPLYTIKDVEYALPHIYSVPINKPFELEKNITIEFLNAGHILGASIVRFSLKGEKETKTIVFSGDLGKQEDPILYPPEVVTQADVLFIESTYGDRNPTDLDVSEEIAQVINDDVYNKGCLVIPSFAVGRTQLILYYIVTLMKERKIPTMPIYIDSPMAISATFLYKQMPEYHKLKKDFFNNCLFDYEKIIYTINPDDSKLINDKKTNCIIISASGMCTGGRIMHHLYHRLPKKNDTVLFVGFQAVETRGRKILEGEKQIKFFGEQVSVKAKIRHLNSLSAHANATELLEWAGNIQESPKRTFVIHGEIKASEALAQSLRDELKWNNVYVPNYLESFDLFDGI